MKPFIIWMVSGCGREVGLRSLSVSVDECQRNKRVQESRRLLSPQFDYNKPTSARYN